jgi:hypothetical protein
VTPGSVGTGAAVPITIDAKGTSSITLVDAVVPVIYDVTKPGDAKARRPASQRTRKG